MTKIVLIPVLLLLPLALAACGAPFTAEELFSQTGEAGDTQAAGAIGVAQAGEAGLPSAGGAAGTGTSGAGSGGDPAPPSGGEPGVGGSPSAGAGSGGSTGETAGAPNAGGSVGGDAGSKGLGCSAPGWVYETPYQTGDVLTGTCQNVGMPGEACTRGKKYWWTCSGPTCAVYAPGADSWWSNWTVGKECQ